MGIEFELKYRATPEIQAAIAGSVEGERTAYTMVTAYYDTPNGALSQRHCTLRKRMENEKSVCTLKMPAERFGRAEFELECGSIHQALPELCKLSGFQELPALVADGLVQVCGARFQRLAITVAAAGCVLELALDRGVLTGGDREIPLCEIEVELKAGSRQAALGYAQALATQYGLTPESKSKFRRAYALAGGTENGRI